MGLKVGVGQSTSESRGDVAGEDPPSTDDGAASEDENEDEGSPESTVQSPKSKVGDLLRNLKSEFALDP
jgi:hypothetical protein